LPTEWIDLSREQTRLLSEINATLVRLEHDQAGISAEMGHLSDNLRKSMAGGIAEHVRVIDFKAPFRSLVVFVFKAWMAILLVWLLVTIVVVGVFTLFLSIFGPAINDAFIRATAGLH
jgi:hypothetical protein